MPKFSELNLLLQKGLPLVERPFLEIANACELRESEVLEYIENLFSENKARRFGAIFDTRRLGFKSTLCAINLHEDELDDKVKIINAQLGVTHCYKRGQPDELRKLCQQNTSTVPNIWFTFIHQTATFEEEIEKLSKKLAPAEIMLLPATKRFKVDVIFNTSANSAKKPIHNPNAPYLQPIKNLAPLNDKEKLLIKLLQGNITISSNLFANIAKQANLSISELLEILREMKRLGRLKRLGIILKHYQVGMRANGMCVWQVTEEDIINFGEILASSSEVSHCYQRPGFTGFPYNLYAMIHGRSWEETYSIYQKLSEKLSFNNGLLLGSLQEFKKSSPTYF